MTTPQDPNRRRREKRRRFKKEMDRLIRSIVQQAKESAEASDKPGAEKSQ